MRVTLAVDAIQPQLSGIGRYTLELARRLPLHPAIAQLHYFARGRLIDDPMRLYRGEPILRGGFPKRLIRRLKARQALKSSVVHGPNFFLPPAADSGVITVHDLSVLRFPETHPRERLLDFEKRLGDSVGRAAHIITDTETVRREVIAEFAVDPAAVTAVHLGIDPIFQPRPADDIRPMLQPLGLAPQGYGLCVATLEPRKKIGELIGAWGALPTSLRAHFPLVIAGGQGWENSGLLDQIAAGKAAGWLRHLGFVDEALLPALYAGAALFVYPSTYEGFGLPPLEALASGAPVLVAARSCLPEVCGEAARYVDPDDHLAFRDGIEAALTDSGWRQAAPIRGSDHARHFTWERCIERTVAVYSAVWQGKLQRRLS